MYKMDERLTIEIRFVKYGEYNEKIYEDKLGNELIWFANSSKLESKEWFKIRTKLYCGLDGSGNIGYYRLYNPREVK